MRKLTSLCAATLLLACATANFIPTNASPRPLTARPVDQVEVFTSTTPERPYAEVGLVTGEAYENTNGAKFVGASYLVQLVREKAAEIGCDGVILKPAGDTAYQGTCIVYK
jgi:hypothetical protein